MRGGCLESDVTQCIHDCKLCTWCIWQTTRHRMIVYMLSFTHIVSPPSHPTPTTCQSYPSVDAIEHLHLHHPLYHENQHYMHYLQNRFNMRYKCQWYRMIWKQRCISNLQEVKCRRRFIVGWYGTWFYPGNIYIIFPTMYCNMNMILCVQWLSRLEWCQYI